LAIGNQSFNDAFISELSNGTGIDSDRIEIENITCGSTHVKFTIIPDTDGVQPTPEQVVKFIAKEMASSNSSLLQLPLLSNINTSQDILATVSTVTYVYCESTHNYVLKGGECPHSDGKGNGLLGLLALLVFLFVLAYFGYRYYRKRKDSEESKQQIRRPSTDGADQIHLEMTPLATGPLDLEEGEALPRSGPPGLEPVEERTPR
jgi:hypothetical protein